MGGGLPQHNMKDLDEQIKEAMAFDPIAAIEKATGKSYKEDERIALASIPLGIAAGERKKELLMLKDDSYFDITIPDFIRLLGRMGFSKVLEEDIPGGEGNKYRIFWRSGVIVSFDSYWGDESVNGGSAYLVTRTNEEGRRPTRSGNGWIDYDNRILHADHDVREGLRMFLEEVERNGEILSKWPSRPFLWLLHYMDTKEPGYDYKKITQARIERLPQEVQDAIGPSSN